MSIWDTIEPGQHRFPFAMKFPNVNFPPSVEEPNGFHIRYVWTAYLDAPSSHPGLRSSEYLTPYRPIICAPPSREWSYCETLYSKKSILAQVKVNLPQHVFSPDEEFDIELQIDCAARDMVVVGVSYILKKHHLGRVLLQTGTAHRSYTRHIMESKLAILGNERSVRIPVHLHIPSRLVSPSFTSQHLRVYYDIEFSIHFEQQGNLFKMPQTAPVTVPIGIANLPCDYLLRVQDLTAVQPYDQSKEAPIFFDPSLDEPPSRISDPWYSQTPALMSPPSPPPSYFSLSGTSNRSSHERVERRVHTSRMVRPGFHAELGDSIVLTNVMDEDW
ncbi:hypothetical protein EC973_008269 [Apophysomyces ossiformis]|uniref:Arrestin C-terminal-like domain-containing protein n=1 Tax=Apophysomyces ossiformis TaxID=679940 RepID=A0A8H7ET89_9FUNG|nr:hypothetical protein EC973_008269 [Apophysomyces ossiformis]